MNAETEIRNKLTEISKILKECQEIAQKEGITFVPISALFTRYDAAEAFWDSSDICW